MEAIEAAPTLGKAKGNCAWPCTTHISEWSHDDSRLWFFKKSGMHFRDCLCLFGLILSCLATLVASGTTGRYSWPVKQGQRSVLVKIDTPGYPLWTWNGDAFEKRYDLESAVIIEFKLDRNNRTLLVNDAPYLSLPLADTTAPAMISAVQIPSSLSNQHTLDDPEATRVLISYLATHRCKTVHLSYDRYIKNRDDPGIVYYNPVFTARIDILGLSTDEDGLVLTDSPAQAYTQIEMANVDGGSSHDLKTVYRLKWIHVLNRDGPWRYPGLVEPDFCRWTSWRCADFGDAPWWRDIWRHRFDENGRIGSGRHAWVVFKKKHGYKLAIGCLIFLPWLGIRGVSMVRRICRRWFPHGLNEALGQLIDREVMATVSDKDKPID